MTQTLQQRACKAGQKLAEHVLKNAGYLVESFRTNEPDESRSLVDLIVRQCGHCDELARHAIDFPGAADPDHYEQVAAERGSTPEAPRFVAAICPGCCPSAKPAPPTFEQVAQARCDLFNATYPVGSTITLCKPDNRRELATVTRQCEIFEEHGFRKPLCVVQLNGSRLVTLGVIDCDI